MARDDDSKPGPLRIEVQFRQLVEYVDIEIADFHHLRRWQRLCPRSFVVVSSDCDNRCDCAQYFQHIRITYVSGVDNQIATTKSLSCLLSNETVRIRDDANGCTDIRHASYEAAERRRSEAARNRRR